MEQLVNFIIRPPRADYSPKRDLLDPEFRLRGRPFHRKDLEVTNSRGNALQCSHYVPVQVPEGTTLPCVIYCHGNSGCRADASEAAIILLPSNITVFALDFSGSGLSEGEHVTLGWNEKDDLKAVVDYLRAEGNVSCIGLWGRSMGAVTSLMYGAEDPSIAGMVLDSPFSNLVDLMMELVDTYKVRLPKFTVKLAIQYMRKIISRKAKFDIMELNVVQVAKSCFVPVLVGHAIDDDFIRPHHSDRIYEAYMGDKNIIKFDGDHNSPRPQFYFDSITIFFHNVLNPPKVAFEERFFQTMPNFIDRDYWDLARELGHETRLEQSTDSTEAAINQLRSVRPMSRTEVPDDIALNEDQLKVQLQGKETVDGLGSSSGLITFDLSKGNDSLMSTTDDQYLEYTFEKFGDIPYDLDDEERQMFMEAVIESLKDLEIRQPQQEGKPPDAASPSSSSTTPGNEQQTSTVKGVDNVTNDTDSLSEERESHAPTTCDPCTSQTGSIIDGGDCSNASVSSETVLPNGKSQVDDSGTAGTRATLKVQKNPASHVIDGLRHRWGLNFFKSS